MSVTLPEDIERLVLARVASGDYATPQQVIREAMHDFVERELARERDLAIIRQKIAEGDSDETNFTPAEVRAHLDRVAASLSMKNPNAA